MTCLVVQVKKKVSVVFCKVKGLWSYVHLVCRMTECELLLSYCFLVTEVKGSIIVEYVAQETGNCNFNASFFNKRFES